MEPQRNVPACLPACLHGWHGVQALADKAADLNVTLGVETVNRYETNVINTAADTMELLADINRGNVVVHLDSYHMNIEEFSMEAAVRTCGDKLGCGLCQS